MDLSYWITIPTYWDVGNGNEIRTVFDHPTPLHSDGTLARMLESFRCLKTKAPILIIVGTSQPDPDFLAHQKVESLLKPFAKEMDIFLVSEKNLPSINKHIQIPFLKIGSYGDIRNVQHAIPYLAGAQAVFGIDDDEIIVDPDYLDKGLASLGKPFGEDIIGGMAGPYFDSNGEYRLLDAPNLASEPNMFLKKNFFMNAALEKVMETKELKRSNVAFGGNMCVTRETIEKTCHDPYIPRGEDYDYVITALSQGVPFYYHPSMGIVHLPPDSTGSQAGDNVNKLVSDIKRFIYVREKFYYLAKLDEEYSVTVEELLPYPGIYLDKNIDMHKEGVEALLSRYPKNFNAQSAETLVKHAQEAAHKHIPIFLEYHRMWKRVLPEIGQSDIIKNEVMALRI